MSGRIADRISWVICFCLFLAGVGTASLAAHFESVPGYMDADYYYVTGRELFRGNGFSEPFLWNYLSSPNRLPAVSHTYWMPLSSLIVAAGMLLGGNENFPNGRMIFILLTGLIPVLSYCLAHQFGLGQRDRLFAGLFSIVPGFYLAYLPTTETFTPNMVLGGVFLLLVGWKPGVQRRWIRYGLWGVIVGGMHLTRTEGVLWILPCLFIIVWEHAKEDMLPPKMRIAYIILAISVFSLGYLLVMGGWYYRNWAEFGRIFPPGGEKTLWLTVYEQTFLFPANSLTFSNWWNSGLGPILGNRWRALITNLQTILAVQGQIVLLPFMFVGLWQQLRCRQVRVGTGMWLIVLGLMTLVFPFAGENGGFFHAGSAIQILLWAVAPVGVSFVVDRLAWQFSWKKTNQFLLFLLVILLITCTLLTVYLFNRRVIGSVSGDRLWDRSARHYQEIESILVERGVKPGERVMVNNPPGYIMVSNRQSLVIPYGDERMLLSAACQFQAVYLILEATNPSQLGNLYHQEYNTSTFIFQFGLGTTKVYAIQCPEMEK
ncbi:MAG TPA: hypothetical protein VIO61_10490 [Anaerolineaceae bacterium]